MGFQSGTSGKEPASAGDEKVYMLINLTYYDNSTGCFMCLQPKQRLQKKKVPVTLCSLKHKVRAKRQVSKLFSLEFSFFSFHQDL